MPGVCISGEYPEFDKSGKFVIPTGSSKNGNNNQKEGPSSCCPFHTDHEVDRLKREQLAREQGRPVYTLTREDESMREALKLFQAVRDDYRTADYGESFNWDEIAAEYKKQLIKFNHLPPRELKTPEEPLDWFAVAFRSQRRKDCDNVDLFDADKNAYEEAYYATNKSLLMYWYTDLDQDNNCLASCVWTDRDIARSVNTLPHHREAAQLSAGSYVHYTVDRCRIQWDPVNSTFKISPW
ncbi:hypothetical protein LPJ72_005057 [Coemansia sp. Benny D160-2]|nr:hypothetical protein LPJ72_005057 [Coemansia sp. Benny D160-2]